LLGWFAVDAAGGQGAGDLPENGREQAVRPGPRSEF